MGDPAPGKAELDKAGWIVPAHFSPEAKITGRCATMVIAASDSLHPEQADYVCDGTDDQVEIQAAIDAILIDQQHGGRSGGTLFLSEGKFHISDTITIEKNIMLIGSGMTSTEIILDDNSDCGMIFFTNYSGAGGDCTYGAGLKQMKLSGNKANQAGVFTALYGLKTNSSDSYFDHLWINDCGLGIYSAAIWSTFFNQISIEGCTSGIYFNAMTNGRLEFVVLTGLNCDQKITMRAKADNTFCRGITIENSNLGGSATPRSFNMIEFEGNVYDCFIQNNRIENQSAAGYYDIKLFGTRANPVPASLKRIIVKNNMFESTNGLGNVYADAATTENIIENNIFYGHATPIVVAAGGNVDGIVHNNIGFITENSGAATLVNGTTSIAVTHGLAVTPAAGDIVVTPIEAWGNMTQFYIDTYTSTQFTIHADINPGQDVDFAWKAIVL